MRYSKYFIPTLKEIPSDAEIISHQLMLRAGLIRKLTTGIYTHLPAGLRSIKKIENIIREEMNRFGAIEVLMPAVQPAELWQESGRWDLYGSELIRFKDRHGRDSCLGPTHEEVITDLLRREIHSYKQMPLTLYQIQNKFRDEIRPRFGLIRGREFLMKDAYSFDTEDKGAEESYELMCETYNRIFSRCGLSFRAVEADTGSIGGSYSHEYMVLAETGEDQIISCTACDYAANLEKAEVKTYKDTDIDPDLFLPVEEVNTPEKRTIEEVTDFLLTTPDRLVKTLIFMADTEVIAVLVRGDHEINEAKLKNLLNVQQIELADSCIIEDVTGAPIGFAGPSGLEIRIVADQAIKRMTNFVTGGNRLDIHLQNVNLARDFKVDLFGDLRFITPGDLCPRCDSEIEFSRGIEVGHTFKLGTKYSKAMKAMFLDENGFEKPAIMGCYGIGITRTLAASIEQNHDDNGIIFPIPIAPFEVVILSLQPNEHEVISTSEKIYRELSDEGIEVLLDDRDLRAGVKFKDADLLGTPIRITIGAKSLRKNEIEMKLRTDTENINIPVQEATRVIVDMVKRLYDSIK